MAYSFTNGQLSLTPTSQTPRVDANPQGGIVSSNGQTDAIFWYVSVLTSHLFAFDATNLANEFYDSSMAGSRDRFGPVVHFEMPIVADGRVYVNGTTQLTVFGLRSQQRRATTRPESKRQRCLSLCRPRFRIPTPATPFKLPAFP